MADNKITALPEDTTPDGDYYVPSVQDPTGSAVTVRSTLAQQVNYVMTTAGDIIYATAARVKARLAIGAKGGILKVNAGATAPEYLAIGTAGQILRTNSGATSPEWVTNPGTNKVRGTVSDPNGAYDQRTVIPLFRADAALTITRIHIHGPDSTATSELDIDLKWADDIFDGSFANAAVIDVCDTTAGKVTIVAGFDDATILNGKYVYWSFGAQPHADWLDFWFEIYYTYD